MEFGIRQSGKIKRKDKDVWHSARIINKVSLARVFMRTTLSIVIMAVLLALLFFGVNLLASALPAMRLDATQGKMYTLTRASLAIAKSPQEPITLTLFYSERLARGRGQIATFGQRIREMLGEYERASGGKINLEVVDPEPLSDAEDRATTAGMDGVVVGETGERFYLGLVGTNAVDGREVISFFDLERERFIEYDISKMIVTLAQTKRRSIALVTSLPMDGILELDPQTGQPRQTRGYRVLDELKAQYEIKNIGERFTEVPAGVDVVWVVHPKALTNEAEKALNSYLMNGGHMLVMVDPVCETDPATARQQGAAPADRASVFPMLAKWGVEIVPKVIAADRTFATRIALGKPGDPPLSYVAWPTFQSDAFNKQDAITGMLTRVTMASPGVVRIVDGVKGLVLEPLIETSMDSMQLPVTLLTVQPNPADLLSRFVSGDEKLTVAARVTGAFTSAFGGGGDGVPAKANEGAMLVVVADADLASDGLWMQEQRMIGTFPVIRKLADNADFIANAIDSLAGSSDLIKIRARQEASRPFTRVDAMRKRADERFLAEQQLLEAKLGQAEERITQLQSDSTKDLVMTPEVQRELDTVREEALKTRRELRQVRLNLKTDVETLGRQLLLINTALAPGLVAVGGLAVAGIRAARRRDAARRRSVAAIVAARAGALGLNDGLNGGPDEAREGGTADGGQR